MANKTVKFNTKLIQDNKVYLPLSDVVKALGYKRADFINEYSQFVEKISGIQCIRETDYNNLLAENETALHKQGQIEVTKIETLRSKIDSVMSFQPLKMLLARDYLQMMAANPSMPRRRSVYPVARKTFLNPYASLSIGACSNQFSHEFC